MFGYFYLLKKLSGRSEDAKINFVVHRYFSSHQIASEQVLKVGTDDAYQFTAKLKIDDEPGEEYRLYIAKKGYLFWLIGSTSEGQLGKCVKKFQAVAKNLKLNLPEIVPELGKLRCSCCRIDHSRSRI